jgi:thiol:disulfide interchange protein DsbD
MIPGMWGAPLKALSGYMPSINTQDFRVQTIKPKYFEAKYSDILHLPHYEMVGFFEIKEAEAYAKKVNKPIFIDFTGHTCPNCRKMDENVLSDPKILNLLNKNYVIVSLYTDEPTIAMEEDWITVKGETLKEIGAINRHYQRTRFHGNAQPFYVLLGKDGKVLCEPRGFNTSVNGFEKFLKKGLEEFKKQNKKEEKKQK